MTLDVLIDELKAACVKAVERSLDRRLAGQALQSHIASTVSAAITGKSDELKSVCEAVVATRRSGSANQQGYRLRDSIGTLRLDADIAGIPVVELEDAVWAQILKILRHAAKVAGGEKCDLSGVIRKVADDLLDAAAVPTAAWREMQARREEETKAFFREEEERARAKAETRIEALKYQIRKLTEERVTLEFRNLRLQAEGAIPFPPAPEPSFDFDLPPTSGVYFFWERRRVAYVGESTCLRDRTKPGHEHRRPGDAVSFHCLPACEIHRAEDYYIGIYNPPRNRLKYRNF